MARTRARTRRCCSPSMPRRSLVNMARTPMSCSWARTTMCGPNGSMGATLIRPGCPGDSVSPNSRELLARMRRSESGLRTDLFDFDLPAERVALRPASPRDSARLLVVRPGDAPEYEDRGVADLPDLLQHGDALVFNDTKVIAARLSGRRIGRGEVPRIEATLTRRRDGSR